MAMQNRTLGKLEGLLESCEEKEHFKFDSDSDGEILETMEADEIHSGPEQS